MRAGISYALAEAMDEGHRGLPQHQQVQQEGFSLAAFHTMNGDRCRRMTDNVTGRHQNGMWLKLRFKLDIREPCVTPNTDER